MLLGQIHEERLKEKDKNIIPPNPYMQLPSYNIPSYKDQIMEYRNKMKEKNRENTFGNKKIITIKDIEEKQMNQLNAMPTMTFSSKMVTMNEIEKKRINENMILFGIHILYL